MVQIDTLRTSAIFVLMGLQYGPASAQCDGSALQIEYGRLVGDGCTGSTETADESCTLTCDAGSNSQGVQGVQGAHLNPLGLFLNPLGLFLRTSIPFIWHILIAFLPA